MVDALPPSEAAFYSEESNAICWEGKSTSQLHELESQYGFYGRSLHQIVTYFLRDDLPPNMWEWREYSKVKSISGMSAVINKNPNASL